MCIQIQAIHQLIVKFSLLLMSYSSISNSSTSSQTHYLQHVCLLLSSNIPFFLLTTIHLIFFAKLKSSNLTSPLLLFLSNHMVSTPSHMILLFFLATSHKTTPHQLCRRTHLCNKMRTLQVPPFFFLGLFFLFLIGQFI
jgi:hypothetical protein